MIAITLTIIPYQVRVAYLRLPWVTLACLRPRVYDDAGGGCASSSHIAPQRDVSSRCHVCWASREGRGAHRSCNVTNHHRRRRACRHHDRRQVGQLIDAIAARPKFSGGFRPRRGCEHIVVTSDRLNPHALMHLLDEVEVTSSTQRERERERKRERERRRSVVVVAFRKPTSPSARRVTRPAIGRVLSSLFPTPSRKPLSVHSVASPSTWRVQ